MESVPALAAAVASIVKFWLGAISLIPLYVPPPFSWSKYLEFAGPNISLFSSLLFSSDSVVWICIMSQA